MVSFYWISFIGALLTIVLGTAFSLLSGGHRDARRNLRLTSPAFLDFWKRFGFIRRTFLLEEEEMKHDATMLERKQQECDNECTRLDKELSLAYKGQVAYGSVHKFCACQLALPDLSGTSTSIHPVYAT
ncbi:hypothetical protein MTO96_005990 [Rhipicephalus appendiculatus]